MKKPHRKKSGPGTLVILSLLLASSGALRLGAEAGTVLAAAGEHGTPAEGAEAAPADCPKPPAALAAALAEREAEIENRSLAVEERMAALDLAEQAITTRMADLEAAEARLKDTLSIANGASEKDIARLVAVYEAMKPKDAAKLFETMQPEFAAGFLARMKPDSAAAVMSGLSSDVAYSISALIAGRNATVPKN